MIKRMVIVVLFVSTSVFADTHYVDLNNPSPTPPYTSWATAARDIQTAVDAAVAGETVWVTNGHYKTTSQISVTKNITIMSVNGPGVTIVDAQSYSRCFNLGNYSCVVSGFTITNGYAIGSGGGVYCSSLVPVVTNCVISGNSSSGSGGGMYSGTANHCTISGNSSSIYGGGMYYGTAKHHIKKMPAAQKAALIRR